MTILINFYNQLFIISIIAGVLYLILKVFSKVTMKFFNASWHYYINIAVYTFLLLPYHKLVFLAISNSTSGIEKDFQLLSYIKKVPSVSKNGLIMTVDIAKNNSTLNFNFFPYLLVMGTVVFILVILIQNIKVYHQIFSVCQLSDDLRYQNVLLKCEKKLGLSSNVSVYISPYLSTPFLYGVLRPCIVLPNIQFTDEELQYIFQHELTHWKRRDTWLKIMMLIINAVHWFNPLVYLARYDIERYCELSCDESVVRTMNNEERRHYCELMLSVLWNATGCDVKIFSAFSDKRKQLERRINMIMKTNGLRSKKWVSIFTVIMVSTLILGGAITAYAIDNNDLAVENKTEVLFSTDVALVAAHTNEVSEVKSDTTMEGERTVNVEPLATGDLGSGKSYSYDKQYLSKGEKVTINAEWTPTGSDINIGLKSSSGTVTSKKVSGGSGSVTYTINSSGDYYIYIGNPSKSSVKFDVSYIVN